MLHFGDYVFLIIILCSVYIVAVRLLELVHQQGTLDKPNQPVPLTTVQRGRSNETRR